MSTNEDRRAEARRRLREQMEAQARRERQLRITAGAVVAVLVLGLVGFVAWKKYDEKQQRIHAENWTSCEYAASTPPEKVDPKQVEAQGGPEMVKQAEAYNKQIDEAEKNKRTGQAPTGEQPKKGTEAVTLNFGSGAVPLTIDNAKAPCNAASFVGLVEQGYFDETPCHRITVDGEKEGLAVVQCGDPTGTGVSGPGYKVVDEPPTDLASSPKGQGSLYPRGTVAMAKSQEKDSAGSQFFLVYQDTTLPPEYSVIGTVGEPGLAVVDGIVKGGIKSTDQNNPDYQKPKKPVVIDRATVDSKDGIPPA